MQKTTKTKRAKPSIYKKHISRRLIREFRTHKSKTHFFTTIAVEADVFKLGSGCEHMYDDVIDFMETAYIAFFHDRLIDPDDDIIMRIAYDLYQAVRAIYVYHLPW